MLIAPGCGKIDKALLGRDPRVAAPWTATLLYQSNFKCGEFRQSGSGHGVIVGPTTVLMSGHFLWGSDTSNAETSRLLPFNSSNFIVALGLKSRQPFSADQYTQFLKAIYFSEMVYNFIVKIENGLIKFYRFLTSACIQDRMSDTQIMTWSFYT